MLKYEGVIMDLIKNQLPWTAGIVADDWTSAIIIQICESKGSKK